ncbi:MAG: pseudaminic acid cytidylyltransferase [Salinisphaeraceae bacterium]|nr:pseudaminic acid cytidylyltransferase [Salinisphaeraceae bacterium]
MNLAVIPARGGSKRIPRKNIRNFCGKPIIVWVIELAKQSELFDRVIVSTDDVEIAEVAASAGADVPFIRPASLANDHAATVPVIAHAIQWMNDNATTPTEVCCLYPTAALIRQGDLHTAKRLLADSEDANYVVPVTRFPYPIQRALQINRHGRAELLHPVTFSARTQDLQTAYHDAGQFYWGRASAWAQESSVFGDKSVALELPRSRVVDIDDEEDWVIAEAMFRVLGLEEERVP